MARLSISLLGPFRLHLDGEPITGLESDKVRALLAYLALESDRLCRRASLASLLWPERPDRAARHDLSQAIYNLRNTLGVKDTDPPFLIATRQTLQFNPLSDHWLDVAAFIELIQACRQHLHRRLDLCEPCIERLHQAIDLYQGELLEGLALGDSLPFEEWLLFQRERFHRLVVSALRSLVRCYRRRREHKQALPHARRYVTLEPCQEEAHRQVMGTLAALGRRSQALVQYEMCCHVLETKLGVDPEAKTKILYRRIRDGKASLGSGTTSPHNLPAHLLPFAGRASELAWIKAHLRDPSCRLLTLVGPGGIGKTRLAVEASGDLLLGDVGLTDQALPFPQGIYFVPLAPLQSHEAIVPALADALGFSFYRGKASGQASAALAPCPRQQVLDYVRDRRLLLILDGFEHLLEGATLVSELLHAAPGVKVLVTSRISLNLQGEWIYRVPALEVQHPARNSPSEVDRVRQCDAVELFATSARCVRPEFEVAEQELQEVAQICRLAQGIPLAILIAAAWIETLSPGQIATQIADHSVDFLHADWRDVPQRQHSMRAVLDRSWSLLAQRQQETLAKLSVFHGGFTDQAAHQVADASPKELAGLVRRSLLRQHTTGSAAAPPHPPTSTRAGGVSGQAIATRCTTC
jgi:predicted ATPase/DNA-binding SARP family transcriptional activator